MKQNKIRSYIIENSELKIQLQQEKKEHEEDLIKKDEEYQTGKQVLEEEYRKSYQENRQLHKQALENQEELKKQKGKVDELQAVISSQQELIQKNEQVDFFYSFHSIESFRKRKYNKRMGK